MKQELIDFVNATAIQYGNFTLKSGEQSNFYLDCRKVSLHPYGLSLISNLIYNLVENDNFQFVGGPCIGADPIVTGLILKIWNAAKTTVPAFLIRPQIKSHGITDRIVGNLQPKSNVVLLEDVTTSGNSLLECVTLVRNLQCNIVKAISVIDRQQGATELFDKHNIPFQSLLTLKELKI